MGNLVWRLNSLLNNFKLMYKFYLRLNLYILGFVEYILSKRADYIIFTLNSSPMSCFSHATLVNDWICQIYERQQSSKILLKQFIHGEFCLCNNTYSQFDNLFEYNICKKDLVPAGILNSIDIITSEIATTRFICQLWKQEKIRRNQVWRIWARGSSRNP
jgi:hypothetical protein